MYCDFFGFSEKPFDVTPDPKFLYLTPGHREALSALVYGIGHRRGFVAVMGEVGTGKTTLLNTVLSQFDEKTKVAYICNTDVSFDEMLTAVLVDLGLATSKETVSKIETVQRIKEYAIRQLANGRNVAIIVDEAQNLDHSSMEGLRLLSNLETPKHKLIQIVLSGQPELDSKLSLPELRQVAQRISIRRYIMPLTKQETYAYIQHRLNVAGYSGRGLFTKRAQQLIWEHSGGVPRKINILCDNALLIGYALRKKRIKASLVEEAIRDLTWSPFMEVVENCTATPIEEWPAHSKRRRSGVGLALATCLILAICILVTLGFLFGDLLGEIKGKGTLTPSALTAANIFSQPDRSEPFEVLGSAVSDEPLLSPQKSEPVDQTDKNILLELALREQGACIGQEQPSAYRSSVKDAESLWPERDPSGQAKTLLTDEPSPILEQVAPATTVLDETELALDDADEQTSGHQASAQVETEEAHLSADPVSSMDYRPISGQKDQFPIRTTRVVVARKGDNLYRLIMKRYGRYDAGILRQVLQENPRITNPDWILVGQAIKLPISAEGGELANKTI